MQDAKFQFLLRMGDNALVLAQRLSQWCGKGPALEEDMAATNVALDLIGQTQLWLGYAGELEGAGRDADQLAYMRDAGAFRNVLLVEQPNGHYGDTLARQFLFDAAHYLMLEALKKSTDSRIAEIAEKALKEVAYHLRRSSDLIIRLGDGTQESHDRMQASIDDLWMYTGELFQDDAGDSELAQAGISVLPSSLRGAWLEHVGGVLEEATLHMPNPDMYMQQGGRHGVHTEHLGYLLAEMQSVQRAYPGAQW